MIQRSQTLFLLGVTGTCLVMLFSGKPYAEIKSDVTVATITYMNTLLASASNPMYPVIAKNTLLIGNTAFAALLGLMAILLYKNRKLQLQIVSFNFIVITAFCGTMYYHVAQALERVSGIPATTYTLLIMYPVILLIFNFLAYRGIRKDINLIRSMDRLR